MYCKGEFPHGYMATPTFIASGMLPGFPELLYEMLAALPEFTPLDKNVFLTQGYCIERKNVLGVWTQVSTPVAWHWKMNETMYDDLHGVGWDYICPILNAVHNECDRRYTEREEEADSGFWPPVYDPW